VFSHLFAATVIVAFVSLGFWQLSRHHERADLNEIIESRSEPPAVPVGEALDRPPADLDYQLVTATGSFADDDVVRVANRSQGGVAGGHLVALLRLDDGRHLLVNRGFVPLDNPDDLVSAPTGTVTIEGWLRGSVEKGLLGATDDGEGTVVPRLNVDDIQNRVDETLEPVWLQLAAPEEVPATNATFPDPVPLPTLGGGPHLSYMGQWWVFATLGLVFYGVLLRRNARASSDSSSVPVQPEPEPEPGDH
jgi:cytochrome oxidase assembly protein ShyY1